MSNPAVVVVGVRVDGYANAIKLRDRLKKHTIELADPKNERTNVVTFGYESAEVWSHWDSLVQRDSNNDDEDSKQIVGVVVAKTWNGAIGLSFVEIQRVNNMMGLISLALLVPLGDVKLWFVGAQI